MKQTILLTIFFALFLIPCIAQENKEDSIQVEQPTEPIHCESILRYVEDAITRARKNADGSLIFILHSGSNESNKWTTLRRKQLRPYIGRFEISTVLALGENVKGNGILAIYLKGKLLYSIPLAKRAELNFATGCIEG